MPSEGSRTYQYRGAPAGAPGRKKGESVPEHVLIMEEKLGRKLKPTESVEHKDGNEKNNAPSNLVVMSRARNYSEGGRRGAAKTNAKRGRAKAPRR